MSRLSKVWTFGKRNIASISLAAEDSVDSLAVFCLLSIFLLSENRLKIAEVLFVCLIRRLQTNVLFDDLFKCFKTKHNLLIEDMVLCLLFGPLK